VGGQSTIRRGASYRLLRALLYCLVLVALVDPADSLTRLKVPLFVSVMVVWLFRYVRNRFGSAAAYNPPRYGLWLTAFVVSFVLPGIATVVGLLNTNIHTGDAPLSLAKSFLFFSIVPVLASEGSDLILVIMRLSFVVALITFAMVVVSFVWPVPFLLITDFLMDHKTAIITPDRDVTGLAAGEFYYASCPLLIFSFAYYLDHTLCNKKARIRNLFFSVCFGGALLLSGARANLLGALCLFFSLLLKRMLYRSGWAPAFILGSALLLVGAAVVMPKFADTKEGSNAIKLNHLRSYMSEFDNRPASLLLGQGANSSFYSEGFQSWTTVTELTYLEFIRIFGLPVSILFAAWLGWLAHSLFKRGSIAIGLAYVTYLAIAASNPLLINSTGFLVLASMYEQATKPCSSTPTKRIGFRLWGASLES
jgi:hypothetical protein